MRIAFDVDGTLIEKTISGRDIPRHKVIDLLRWFQSQGHDVYVWSGGGIEYAKEWSHKLGLHDVTICPKGGLSMEISVDDEEVELAKVNIKV